MLGAAAVLGKRGSAYNVSGYCDIGWARLALIWHMPQETLPKHDHARACIHYFLKGHYFESFDSQTIVAGQGSMLIKACDQPHANVMGAQLSLALRIELCDDHSLDSAFALIPNAAQTNALRRLAIEMQSGENGETLERSAVLALSTIRSQQSIEELSHEDKAAHRLLAATDKDVRIEDLARELGVDRCHLARRFQQRFGCGMKEFMLRSRASRVLERVGFKQQSLGEAMIEEGFYDQSHGTRVLRQLLGRSPSAWLSEQRRLLQS